MYTIIAIFALLFCVHGQDLDYLMTTMLPVTSTPYPTNTRKPSTLVPGLPTTAPDFSCTTADGKVGVCVQYYLCNNNSVITDGIGLIDIRASDGGCPSYMDLCCQLEDQRPPEDPITPKPDLAGPTRVGCGWSNPKGAGMHTTGEVDGETKFGEFPWMVAILKVSSFNGSPYLEYIGGGSLIHPSVVLTVAHYVVSTNELYVRAGEWDTQNTKEPYPHQEEAVQTIEVHKDFNSGNMFYDIALLFLAQPLKMAPNVGVACLPPTPDRVPHGMRCIATGWGKKNFGKEGTYQVILKKIELPVVDRNTCQTQLQNTRLGRFFRLHTSFMCAGGEPGKDTCKGDGGSPLSCPIEFEKDRYMQSGIVAWGIGCGDDGTPGVYVDVANLRAWIDDKVVGKGYDPKIYQF